MSWPLAGGTAALVLVGAGIAFAVWHKLDQAEQRAEKRAAELRKEIAETLDAARKELDARSEQVRQMIAESTKAERRSLQRQTMDQDARLLAAAAQQYFLESCQTVVAIGYDSRTGELSGPVANYVRRIAPGYAVVPNELKLEGVFTLQHPDAGLAQGYHEDGRPVAVPQ